MEIMENDFHLTWKDMRKTHRLLFMCFEGLLTLWCLIKGGDIRTLLPVFPWLSSASLQLSSRITRLILAKLAWDESSFSQISSRTFHPIRNVTFSHLNSCKMNSTLIYYILLTILPETLLKSPQWCLNRKRSSNIQNLSSQLWFVCSLESIDIFLLEQLEQIAQVCCGVSLSEDTWKFLKTCSWSNWLQVGWIRSQPSCGSVIKCIKLSSGTALKHSSGTMFHISLWGKT